MIKITKKNIFAIVILILFYFCLFFLLQKVDKQPINKVGLSNYIPQEKQYLLILLNGYSLVSNTSVFYPTVKTSPNDIKYLFTSIKEYVDLKINHDYLSFASKRVAELATWRDNVNWDNILNEYFKLVSNYISLLTQQTLPPTNPSQSLQPLLQLKQVLSTHHLDLQNILFDSTMSKKKKERLQGLLDNVFKNLNSKINKFFLPYNPFYLKYSLSDVIAEKEYGFYEATIDVSNMPGYFQKSIQLQVGKNTYSGIISPESKLLTFENIEIPNQKDVDFISLKLPKINIFSGQIPTLQKNQSNDYSEYAYYFDIPDLETGKNFLLKLDYLLDDPVIVQLNQISVNEKGGSEITNLINETIYPHKKKFVIYKQFQIEQKKANSFNRFILVSKKPILRSGLKSIVLEIIPVFEPEITILKEKSLPNLNSTVSYKKISDNKYSITTTNTTLDQNNYIYNSLGFGWIMNKKGQAEYLPTKYVYYFWILTNIGLVFLIYYFLFQPQWIKQLTSQETKIQLYKTFKFIIKILLKPFGSLWRFIKRLIIRLRFILLLITIIGIIFNVFLINQNYDFTILFFALIWLVLVIGYQAESRVIFFFALLFLTLCPFLLILKLNFIAEKSAIWAYMMLIIGAISFGIEIKNKKTELVDYHLLFKNVLNDLKTVCPIINHNIKVLFVKIFGNKFASMLLFSKRSLLSIRFFFIKFVKILLPSFFIIGLTIILSLPKIQAYRLKMRRLSINPKIEKIQPWLVYPGQKLIISGKNFCFETGQTCNLEFSNKLTPIIAPMMEDKVTFALPLSWPKNTEIYVRVIKRIRWLGKIEIAKSNVVKFKILDPLAPWSQETDEFFEQLRNLDKEALQINGYNIDNK